MYLSWKQIDLKIMLEIQKALFILKHNFLNSIVYSQGIVDSSFNFNLFGKKNLNVIIIFLSVSFLYS